MTSRRAQIDRQHRWLSLLEVTGIVVSEPVLAEVAPAGFAWLPSAKLAAFRKALDIRNLPKGMTEGDPNKGWIRFILEEMLELKQRYWKIGAEITSELVAELPLANEVLRPTRVLMDGSKPALLMIEVPAEQSLDRPWVDDDRGWRASPTTKLERLLRETGVELGLLTNGEDWRVLVASPSETASWITWTAESWSQATSTLVAFVELMGAARFLAGPVQDTLLAIIRRSRERQLDVTDQLGEQTREALGIFIDALDRADREVDDVLLEGFSLDEILEAASVFLMRLIFILYAEENSLLPHGSVAYDRSYGLIHLLTELETRHRISPEELTSSYEAYARVLATARCVHDGSPDPEINLAPHGGRLFDPGIHPLLEGRASTGKGLLPYTGPPRIPDRAMRSILRSLKYARASGGSLQLVSYKRLAVEQIGYMYEGLLTRELARAPSDQAIILLEASDRSHIPMLTITELRTLDDHELAAMVSEHTGRSVDAILLTLTDAPSETAINDARAILAGEDEHTMQRAALLSRDMGIVRSGGLYVTTSDARAMQGAHYTPAALTEPIVRHALEPLTYECMKDKPGVLKEPRIVRTPEEMLSLKVCDPAMGSGAFLVQAIRYLGDRLAESWDRAASQAIGPLTLPEAVPSRGMADEHLMPTSAEERRIEAYRYVAERCIYGVDRSHLAVEMAKLSLWLTTFSVGRRFTFLDHALKLGDCLIGALLEQISSWQLTPGADSLPLLDTVIAQSIKEVTTARTKISDLSGKDDEAPKQHALEDADRAASNVHLLGDLLIGAAYAGQSNASRVALRERARELALSLTKRKVRAEAIAEARTMLAGQPTFHWEIEFPEVFSRGGFDAIIGNPPFLGGRKLRRALGDRFTELLPELYRGASLNADLCAFFFLRAFTLIREGGRLGLIATKTIGEGDTRETGLARILKGGATITRAIREMPWPGDATVTISILWLSKGKWSGPIIIDDRKVDSISSALTDEIESPNPHPLESNQDLSFQGSVLAGIGFIIDEEEVNRLLQEDPSNADVLMPLLGGEDITTSPRQVPSRWCINFFDWPLEKAEKYKGPMKIIRSLVLPYRRKVRREAHRRRWWQYGDKRPRLYRTIKDLHRVLACSRVSARWVPALVPHGCVYTDATVVFADNSFSFFSVIQSSLHEIWKDRRGTRLETRSRYTPTYSFDTFPFPNRPSAIVPALEEIGRRYDEHRREMLVRRDIGLTEAYNLFHEFERVDDDVAKLRDLHRELDHRVAAAYGWTDLQLDHGWHDENTRWGISDAACKDILQRLYVLNQKRYAEEQQETQLATA